MSVRPVLAPYIPVADMLVQTYQNDGYTIKTGWSDGANDFIVNNTTNYKVVGDLMFKQRADNQVPDGAVVLVLVRRGVAIALRCPSCAV